MTCSEFLAQLDDLIDNNVTVPVRAQLEEHLRGCEHCVVTLSTTRKTIDIVWNTANSDTAEPRLIHLHCNHTRQPPRLA